MNTLKFTKALQEEVDFMNTKIRKIREDRLRSKDPLYGLATENTLCTISDSYTRIINSVSFPKDT